MGAGKTTTGRKLARMLRLPFLDADAEIERLHGPIAQIFAREGEARFRRIESDVLESICQGSPKVIAVGGGAVLSAANRRLLRRRGWIVHLQISPEAAFARVANRRHRPLLGDKPDVEVIRSLLARRHDAYHDNDFSLAVGTRDSRVLAAAIARWYRGKLRRVAKQRGNGR